MTKKITKNFVIIGTVQGVGFRMATYNQAHDLGLAGWVRNLPNGDVEVLAQGPKAKMEDLEDWLHQGPPTANVLNIAVHDHADIELGNFAVRD